MIEGVKIVDKRVIRDERGAVLHMLRRDSEDYHSDFGEIYFSKIRQGIVKGWKKHLINIQRLVVPVGEVKFVLFDTRKESKTFNEVLTICLSEDNYKMLVIPPNITYAFQGISTGESLVANCSNKVFEQGESETIPVESNLIPYRWKGI
ncbi:dTDP-4-dehydrorhamnose 3,5-epimerase family protein [Pseudobacteriovorax antillogorgiicola]|uniref:dTDP-4-dehydrorhamnose 3,5-epimerase n=1 Tax=Pseudobacteriovorax antillogorgiicola TaxID=1513793 RepID=A0A1Y6CMW7_9BACT|nr:dTDP-4-dehydrorhamnose 3,5-epimerase family protein [Pseudobacteriovorax antillogorgiicola]TCS45217.1 dTDP-4-dehydrorhamnose 3,5-epimerase [Pseudobacteriovorax antillogorgiicola]SMF75444.1 dTDP-4-dehydrorhamnose 3,5-epimerase [Pseudobacteriovorax antillogorgiicola]